MVAVGTRMESNAPGMNNNLREQLERLKNRQHDENGAGCPFVLAPLLQTHRARLKSKYGAQQQKRVDRAHVLRVGGCQSVPLIEECVLLQVCARFNSIRV